MSAYLGIDTSNYTTSVAVFESGEEVVLQKKKNLSVKEGEKGLRQSEALFQHTLVLPDLMEQLLSGKKIRLSAVGVSSAPRDVEGSYMPCFLAGLNAAGCIAAAGNLPLFRFSHQAGHIAAALYSSNKLNLINQSFIAFHVSGGTTEALLVKPDTKKIINTEIICGTLDLNAGQAVDRIGVMLGTAFPCGHHLDMLAQKSAKQFKINPTVKEGNCSFSGLENRCAAMFSNGESREDICLYCVEYISESLDKMVSYAFEKCGHLPLLFTGGVMSNSIIRKRFPAKYGAYFAEPEFSADNAAGTAILASLRCKRGQ